MTSPDDQAIGAELCMRRALEDAQVTPRHVGYVNAHATSTPQGDPLECKAIASVIHVTLCILQQFSC